MTASHGRGVERPYLAIVLVLLAYLFFSFIDTGVKWLTIAGLPALQLSFMRYAGHFVISSSIEVARGSSVSAFKTPKLGLVVLRGALLAGSTVLNFVALKTLSLTLTSTIMFLSPVIVCALSYPILGERVGPLRSFAVLLGFAGILIAVRPFSEEFDPAALYSFGGAVCFAFYMILTRILSGQVSTDAMQFFSGFVGAAALLPVAIYTWQSPDNIVDWIILIVIGVMGWVGHEFMTRAYAYTQASNLVPFGYTFIIYVGLWSWLLFAHVPDIWNVSGAVVVTIAGLIIWVREVQRARSRKTDAERQL